MELELQKFLSFHMHAGNLSPLQEEQVILAIELSTPPRLEILNYEN